MFSIAHGTTKASLLAGSSESRIEVIQNCGSNLVVELILVSLLVRRTQQIRTLRIIIYVTYMNTYKYLNVITMWPYLPIFIVHWYCKQISYIYI